jgi:hypothetical protein
MGLPLFRTLRPLSKFIISLFLVKSIYNRLFLVTEAKQSSGAACDPPAGIGGALAEPAAPDQETPRPARRLDCSAALAMTADSGAAGNGSLVGCPYRNGSPDRPSLGALRDRFQPACGIGGARAEPAGPDPATLRPCTTAGLLRFARNDDIFFLKTSINATVLFVAFLRPVIHMYRLPKSPAAQAQIPAPGGGPTRRIRRAERAVEIFLLAKH